MTPPSGACLAVIPARGGSKRIPKKNIRLLAGKPLLAFTIAAAIDSALANLNSIWQTASEEMYKNTQGGQQGPQPGQQHGPEQGGSQKGSGNDEVTDVDFEEVKDK